jgi:hypothetical protein
MYALYALYACVCMCMHVYACVCMCMHVLIPVKLLCSETPIGRSFGSVRFGSVRFPDTLVWFDRYRDFARSLCTI